MADPARDPADPQVLTLRAEAADEDHPQRVGQLVADHLEGFSGSDHSTAVWPSPEGDDEQHGAAFWLQLLPPAQTLTETPAQRRRT